LPSVPKGLILTNGRIILAPARNRFFTPYLLIQGFNTNIVERRTKK